MSIRRKTRQLPALPEDNPQQFFNFNEEGILESANDPFLPEDFDPESDAAPDEEGVVSFYLAPSILRSAAFFIDIILVIAMATLVLSGGLYFSGFNFDFTEDSFTDVLIKAYFTLILLGSSYFIFFHAYGGKTLGKMLFGIRVIGDDGELVGIRKSLIRWAGYFISALFAFIGFIWAIFDSQGQTWHDKIAGTYVVRD